MIDLSKEKLVLEYPCSWEYKLVVLEHIDIHITVRKKLTSLFQLEQRNVFCEILAGLAREQC